LLQLFKGWKSYAAKKYWPACSRDFMCPRSMGYFSSD